MRDTVLTYHARSPKIRRTKTFLSIAASALMRVSYSAALIAFVGLGGADGALRAVAHSELVSALASSIVPATAEAAMPHQHIAAPSQAWIWTIDTDQDGSADYSNPTHGGVRGIDAFGSGQFGAGRDAGKRRHHGVDYIAAPGAIVRAPISGKVTHIGFAYGGAEQLRSIEIVNAESGLRSRVLYIAPTVNEGDTISAGDMIGVAQDLSARYPGITNHVHVELRDARRVLLDASEQLPSAPVTQALSATLNAPS